MQIEMIMAVAENGVIGHKGAMPWRLREDMRRFKQLTLGHSVIMGRRTWESLPKKPLPDRQNIVLTTALALDGATIASTIDAALDTAKQKIMIIGGGQIYKVFEPLAQRIHLTRIEGEIIGDTYFHLATPDEWQASPPQHFTADEHNSHNYSFITLERKHHA